jgi:hypothetical protein
MKTFQNKCISEHDNSTTCIDYNIQFLRKILLLPQLLMKNISRHTENVLRQPKCVVATVITLLILLSCVDDNVTNMHIYKINEGW